MSDKRQEKQYDENDEYIQPINLFDYYEDENTEDYEVDYNDETNNKEEYLDFDNSDKPVEKYSARKTN